MESTEVWAFSFIYNVTRQNKDEEERKKKKKNSVDTRKSGSEFGPNVTSVK